MKYFYNFTFGQSSQAYSLFAWFSLSNFLYWFFIGLFGLFARLFGLFVYLFGLFACLFGSLFDCWHIFFESSGSIVDDSQIVVLSLFQDLFCCFFLFFCLFQCFLEFFNFLCSFLLLAHSLLVFFFSLKMSDSDFEKLLFSDWMLFSSFFVLFISLL